MFLLTSQFVADPFASNGNSGNVNVEDVELKDIHDKIHSLGELMINDRQCPSGKSRIPDGYLTNEEVIESITKYVKNFEYTSDLITRKALETLYQVFQLSDIKKDLAREALVQIFSDPSTRDRTWKTYMEIIQEHAREAFKDLNIEDIEVLSRKNDSTDETGIRSRQEFQKGVQSEKDLLTLMENTISKRTAQLSINQVDKIEHSYDFIISLLIMIKSSRSEKINLFDKLYLTSNPEGFLKTGDRLSLLFSLEDKIFAQEACRELANHYPRLNERYKTLVARGARTNLSNCFWEYSMNSNSGKKFIKTSDKDSPELIEAYHLMNLSRDAIEIDKALGIVKMISQRALDKPNEWIKDSFKTMINNLYLYGISIKKLRKEQNDVRYTKVLKILQDLSGREGGNLEKQIYVKEAFKSLKLIFFGDQKSFHNTPFAPPEVMNPSLGFYSYRFDWHINIILTDLKHYPLAWIPEGFGKQN
ncbi:hypothetical protein DFH28DRAFT_897562 [Melampsora americana]|nr:hypothetical protein DFH28DRAFT_897562 [Melampsora americana]